MKYFSGFCFAGESALFESLTCKGDFCVVGFSYGAQKALEYALTCKERIDKLQLISPAFFNDKDEKFKKLQNISFRKDSDAYSKNFLQSVVYPSDIDVQNYFHKGMAEELKELLSYEWSEEKLQQLKQKGVIIEVYIGEQDKIIDALHVNDFFSKYADIYFIKGVGHLLR